MATLIEEIKPVVLVKFEFESREKLNLIFSLEFSDFQDTDAIQKSNDCLIENSSTSAVFSIEFLVEEIELVVAQN